MKKISYYLVLVVVLSVGLISLWIYQKYLKTDEKPIIAFQVVRGDLREAVNVRGEIVSQKEFDLEFPFGGTIENVYAKEGDRMKYGDPLMRLGTEDLDFERSRLNAILTQKEAAFEKLLVGSSAEELDVFNSKVVAAEQSLADARKTLFDALSMSLTVADDAVHNTADQFFSNPRTATPTFNQTITNTQLKTDLAGSRYRTELILLDWGKITYSDTQHILENSGTTREYLYSVKTFLADVATAVNSITATASISQATLDTWKASVLSARTAVDSAITLVIAGESKVRSADSALAVAESELALKKSKPQNEDVVIARTQIEETKNAISSIDEKIRKSTLRAPGDGVVKKIMLEEKEIFKQGMTALIFASEGYKIQSDISELDIGKIRYVNGNDALVRFDAFPQATFNGKVVFIEPKEVIKDNDVYFRADVFLEKQDDETMLRSGLSADVVFYGLLRKDVLMVPEIAIEKRGGLSYVKIAPSATSKEDVDIKTLVDQQVTTGVSDGEFVEILTGLSQGEVIVVLSE